MLQIPLDFTSIGGIIEVDTDYYSNGGYRDMISRESYLSTIEENAAFMIGGFMVTDEQMSALMAAASHAYDTRVSLGLPIYSMFMSDEARAELDTWSIKNKSPFSASYYNMDGIGWGSKPVGHLRLSDHWSFESQNEHHCRLATSPDRQVNGWKLCRYDGKFYHIVAEYEAANYTTQTIEF